MCNTKIFIITVFVVALSCNRLEKRENKETDSFTINAKIKGLEGDMAILGYMDMGKRMFVNLDSASINDGSFQFDGSVNFPRELTISIIPGGMYFTVFVENADINVSGDVADAEEQRGRSKLNVSVTGSKMHEDAMAYAELNKNLMERAKPLIAKFDSLNRVYIEAKKTPEPEKKLEALKKQTDEAKDKIDELRAPRDRVTEKFIGDNPNSHFSAVLLRRTNNYTYDEGVTVFNKLSPEVKDGYYGKQIQEALIKLKKASPGAKASTFSAIDINGDSLELSDYMGQYVLLDFWASWCKPCRAGNPHLLKLYNKYHNKGFEIIGISDDDGNHEAWHKAVAKDKIGVWKHVLRGAKFNEKTYKVLNDEISEPYDIHTLPTKILINPEGMIIGRYGGRGENDEALDKKLEGIFGA